MNLQAALASQKTWPAVAARYHSTMRCPFCASPRAMLPNCWACGMALEGVDMHAVHSTLDDLEPTRYSPVQVHVEPVKELVPTALPHPVTAALTDTELEANIPCAVCNRPRGLATVCGFCGAARVLARDTADPHPTVSCRYCGTPNPAHRDLCLSCGIRMEALEA